MDVASFRHQAAVLQRLLDADFAAVQTQLAGWDEREWRDFAAFLKAQRARSCFAYFVATVSSLGPIVPAWLTQDLGDYLSSLDEKAEQFRVLRRRVCDVLEDRAIDYLIIKGDTIGLRFYPRGQRRQQFDIDLMVREADVNRAVGALAELGLRLPGERSAVKRRWLRSKHAEGLSDGHLSIDLHWALRRGPGYRLSMESLWDSRQHVSIGSRPVPTLSDEYLLVLLSLSLAHDLGRGAACLKHWIDFHYTLREVGSELVSEGFWRRRQEERIARVCAETLGLVEAILPGSLPRSFVSDIPASLSPQEAWQLLANPRDAFDNSLWILRLHELWKPVKLYSFIRQNLSHPGRLPLCSYQLTRFAYRCAVRGTLTAWNRGAG